MDSSMFTMEEPWTTTTYINKSKHVSESQLKAEQTEETRTGPGSQLKAGPGPTLATGLDEIINTTSYVDHGSRQTGSGTGSVDTARFDRTETGASMALAPVKQPSEHIAVLPVKLGVYEFTTRGRSVSKCRQYMPLYGTADGWRSIRDHLGVGDQETPSTRIYTSEITPAERKTHGEP
ncbi:hypothetical protein EVAR_65317_1 [Eumeta japonica]|uniref:Uncharacterized protein n=1 Tax=Eumeta variegata TaxID=151549 RepID=A0A4C1YWN1_EUMVA|nr:hypothetical protein EVAR_65317_1 [Eumeta japonica]